MALFRKYRAALAAFVLMFSMAITTTALSFFVVPVCSELGLSRGSFTVYYSFLTASGAAAAPFLGQVIQKRGIRSILSVGPIWVCTGLFLFSFSGKLWMFYAVAAVMGVFGTACVSLCAPIIVQQSYERSRASGILGIVMSGSGLGGMVLSLFLPGLIEALGWRWGYRFLGILWLVLGSCSRLLLGKETIGSAAVQRREETEGMTRTSALRDPRLYLLTLVMFILSAACGIQTQLPPLLSGYGFGTAQVSSMVSFFTASLAGGKIAQGLLYSKIGPRRGGLPVLAAFSVGFLLLQMPGFTVAALAMLAVGMGSVTTLMPTLTRSVFDSRSYAAIWSILSTASNVGTLIAAPLYGTVYDISGSYGPALVASFLGLAICSVLLHMTLRKE